VKRTTVTLSDELCQRLEQDCQSPDAPPALSTLVQAAVREYLARRGYPVRTVAGSFRITPAARGGGAASSVAHDGYRAEAMRALGAPRPSPTPSRSTPRSIRTTPTITARRPKSCD
jgi:hypothetical protein